MFVGGLLLEWIPWCLEFKNADDWLHFSGGSDNIWTQKICFDDDFAVTLFHKQHSFTPKLQIWIYQQRSRTHMTKLEYRHWFYRKRFGNSNLTFLPCELGKYLWSSYAKIIRLRLINSFQTTLEKLYQKNWFWLLTSYSKQHPWIVLYTFFQIDCVHDLFLIFCAL